MASLTRGLGSEPYTPDNLFDRLSSPSSLEYNYQYLFARERALLSQALGLAGGDVLSVGCGWNPGRHLFPAPAFRLVGVDTDPGLVAALPQDAFEAINRIQTRQRYNQVVSTGSPGFIPQDR